MTALIRRHIHHGNVSVTLFAECLRKSDIRLTAVIFGRHDSYKGVKANLSDNIIFRKYADRVLDIIDNGACNLGAIKLSLRGCTDFQRSVLKATRKIPRGQTVSYKELAEMSGHPNAVRAVASVMRNNRFPLIIPCHRVIRSDGTIGGFAGQHTGKMVKLKKQLLDLEKKYRN